MKHNNEPSFRRLLAPSLLALSLGLAAVAMAADRQIFDEQVTIRKLDEVRVKALVAKALPAWDDKVLSASDGPDWPAKASFSQVLVAVEDRAEAMPTAGAPRLKDKDRAISLDPVIGKVRYASKARRWSLKQTSREPVEKQQAVDLAVKALTTVGVPRAEFGKVRVDTQVGVSGGGQVAIDDTQAGRRQKMYRVVSLGRRVNGLPVLASRARVAVSNQGAIQRLKINWPTFRLEQGLALRSRDAVLDQVVQSLMAHTPSADIKIKAQLAYAFPALTRDRSPESGEKTDLSMPAQGTGRDADDTPMTPSRLTKPPGARPSGVEVPPRAVPVVILSVSSEPTPFQILVPVAEAK